MRDQRSVQTQMPPTEHRISANDPVVAPSAPPKRSPPKNDRKIPPCTASRRGCSDAARRRRSRGVPKTGSRMPPSNSLFHNGLVILEPGARSDAERHCGSLGLGWIILHRGAGRWRKLRERFRMPSGTPDGKLRRGPPVTTAAAWMGCLARLEQCNTLSYAELVAGDFAAGTATCTLTSRAAAV